MWTMLPGLKTHLTVLAGIITVAVMFLNNELALGEAIQRALEVLSVSMLRIGVAGAGPK
jgi:hypothetical protein